MSLDFKYTARHIGGVRVELARTSLVFGGRDMDPLILESVFDDSRLLTASVFLR